MTMTHRSTERSIMFDCKKSLTLLDNDDDNDDDDQQINSDER